MTGELLIAGMRSAELSKTEVASMELAEVKGIASEVLEPLFGSAARVSVTLTPGTTGNLFARFFVVPMPVLACGQ